MPAAHQHRSSSCAALNCLPFSNATRPNPGLAVPISKKLHSLLVDRCQNEHEPTPRLPLPGIFRSTITPELMLCAMTDDKRIHHVGHQFLYLWDNWRLLRILREAVVIDRRCPVQ